jgi:hypothetical protein
MDLLILIWRSPECRVPNDLAWIARRLRVDESELPTLQSVVAEFLISTGNWLTQKRLKREWAYTFEKRKKNIESAKSRWGKGKASSERNATEAGVGNANAMPPHPHPHPQYSEDKSSGADAPIDPVKIMFDSGRSLLTAAGKTPDAAGKLLGKWRGDHGVEAVIAALGQAQREGAIDPVAFIEGCLKQKARRATEIRIGTRKVNSAGQTVEWEGDYRGWVKVYE